MFEHEPDFLEKRVCFACGLPGGTISGFILMLKDGNASAHELAFCVVDSALASAACAVKFGDSFWRFIFFLLSCGR